jgi:putative toxin-antitoxin system antitoxin component (TIGR02293 family)
MISTGRLVRTLGGKSVFREHLATFETIIEKARAGFPYATLEALAARFGIPQESLVRVLHLPPRTLARRKKARRLSAAESDRLLRLARVAARAEDVFGSQERAGAWLRGTVRALGSVRPVDLLDTDLGAQQVERILGRIEHGVYS